MSSGMSSMKCHYCYQMVHMMGFGKVKDEHLQAGKIMIEGCALKIKDGSFIPREPSHLPLKDRLETVFAERNKVSQNLYMAGYNDDPTVQKLILQSDIPKEPSVYQQALYDDSDRTMDEI